MQWQEQRKYSNPPLSKTTKATNTMERYERNNNGGNQKKSEI
jgi:hypothetical protein